MSGRRGATGGVTVDRGHPIPFAWGGRRYVGFAGDTLASALLANGVSVVGRSFKYHRPRGLLAAGLEEPNGVVQLERGAITIPNVKATQIELYDGLTAEPVNVWPSLEFDLLAVNDLVKRFIPAAFYYKTFFWPHWRLFEPFIRRAAGLGVAPGEPDPDTYEHRFAHVDVLVVGSGAAGLAAAEAAAASPSADRVLLVETDSEFGGGLLSLAGTVEGRSGMTWRNALLDRLRRLPNVTALGRTTAFGFYDHGLVALCERLSDHLPPSARSGPRQRLWKVRANRVVLATGAFERPIAFKGNDLPGVMLASAAQTYVRRFGVLAGRRIAVCTNNDSAYEAAFVLQDAGCDIAAIIDSRTSPGSLAGAAASRSIEVIGGSAPVVAKGGRSVTGLDVDLPTGRAKRSLACDAVLISDGWNPAVHLHSQSGGTLAYDDRLRTFIPAQAAQNSVSVGAAAGIFDLAQAIESGRAAGRGDTFNRGEPIAVGSARSFRDGDAGAQAAWLDFQNDVTVADVQLAARENFRSVEHLKRYTTLGMASDQGKTSNIAGIHVMSDLLGKSPAEIGVTKFRPPFDPVTIGVFAGRAVGEDLAPIAHAPAHAAQVALGARMERYGGWLRAAYFPRAGDTEDQALSREVLGVRRSAGLFDASTLGKIEVKGPDATEFLQRIYVGGVRTLKVGHCRYGLMLNENGIVFDDGVLTRMGSNHFLVGTTSGHAAAVADGFNEWLQCEWPHLRVMVENVTTSWAVINIVGPLARRVLAATDADIDLSPEAFPHMAFRRCAIGGAPARIQRVSFTGEPSYEVAVPWGFGASLWKELMHAGRPHDITPFGVESLMVMRVEKGFLHVGADTDGTTYPQDVGFAAAFENKKDDFVGRRSTMRSDAVRHDRRQLVGLQVEGGQGPLNAGAHILPPGATAPKGTHGWVTSSVYSPTLGKPIALALVESGRRRLGETVQVWDLGKRQAATIVDPCFFDPAGNRLHG